jgi:hypothetical protein
MKTGRWLTGTGSVILFLTGIGHGFRIADVEKMIVASGLKGPLEAILKGCWLVFSGEMIALAVIAVVASRLPKGGSIILICAATMFANAGLLLHFVGPFFGVYVSVVVALFFVVGGWLQVKQSA